MKSSTLVAVLARLTIVMAVAAPVIVFGFLYVLFIQPQRDAAQAAQRSLDALRAQVDRQRTAVHRAAVVTSSGAREQFEARTADSDPAPEVAQALAALLNAPAVGGVTNLVIETGEAAKAPPESRLAVFGGQLAYTPITVAFDARFEQIGRFLWNLRTLPSTFEVRSVEVASGRGSAVRARLALFAYHRPAPIQQRPEWVGQPRLVDVTTPPQWKRNPFTTAVRPAAARARARVVPGQPEPVVSSILFTSGRRIARVDGRLVRVGDRLGAGVVTAIEPDGVIVAGEGSGERRLALERALPRTSRR
jgi:hypothetical protein